MKNRPFLVECMMVFCVCTACITVLCGVLGSVFMPEVRFGFDAFFSPPIFGFLSTVFGLVGYSKKELSIKQLMIRRTIHLILIEGAVFGLNYFSGTVFEPVLSIMLALSVAVTYILVHVILWLNDLYSAARFNEKLKIYQEKA